MASSFELSDCDLDLAGDRLYAMLTEVILPMESDKELEDDQVGYEQEEEESSGLQEQAQGLPVYMMRRPATAKGTLSDLYLLKCSQYKFVCR